MQSGVIVHFIDNLLFILLRTIELSTLNSH